MGQSKKDAIKAKLKELTGREKIDKTLVDYVFVLFDPTNSPQLLRTKLVDFLGDKTDPFVEWFARVVSQVDNQVSKAGSGGEKESATKEGDLKPEQNVVQTEAERAADACFDGILPQEKKKERVVEVEPPPKAERQSSHSKTDERDGSSSRRSRRHRDRSEKSQKNHEEKSRHKEHGERSGAASRMLSKAAQDAVKSVQSVGESRSHGGATTGHSAAGSRDKPRDVSPRAERREYGLEITVAGGDYTASSPEPASQLDNTEVVSPRESPEPADTVIEKASPEETEEPEMQDVHPISVVTRSGTNHKRTFDEAMEVETFHQNPVLVTAERGQLGGTNRFVYASAQGPLIVPEKESEENEPMDDNHIPGLLVVMPAINHDPLSRIKLGNEDFMYGGGYPGPFDHSQRFPGHTRMPFAHIPPYASGYWGEPMEEDFNQVHPAKRLRKAAAAPIDPSLIMCRFLPKCAKLAEDCPYFHPACRNGKLCRFGDSCVYDHSGGATPAADAKQLRTKIPICRFYPNCTQPQCQFLHKQAIACSFGTYCRSGPSACQFLHPEDVLPDTESTLQIPDYNDDDSELDLELDGSKFSHEEMTSHGQTA